MSYGLRWNAPLNGQCATLGEAPNWRKKKSGSARQIRWLLMSSNSEDVRAVIRRRVVIVTVAIDFWIVFAPQKPRLKSSKRAQDGLCRRRAR